MRRDRWDSPDWPLIGASALVGAAVGVVVVGNLFTEGKRLKEGVKAPYAIGDREFIRSVSHLLGAPMVDGNEITALHNGAEIFPAMLEAIRGAQRTITFENFVFSRGRIGWEFTHALAERARAGVRVHMLQDAFGCNCLRGEEFDLMEAAGVEIEVYRWFHLTRINERTHRKLLVVDGKVGFTGGTGIDDRWLGHGNRPDEWRDSHFRLEGPAVGQMQEAFLDNWMATRGCVLHGDDYFPEIAHVGNRLCQVFKSSADEGSDSTRLLYLVSCAAARHTIRIANAYFIPDELLMDALLDARARGVEVEIIVPGPLIDQQFVRVVSRARWGPLLRSGVRIYEFQPTNFHCKYFIADDCWVTVGSTNLDARSLIFNEECNTNVLDAGFGAEMTELFARDKAQSKEVTLEEWRRRPLAQRIGGAIGGLFSRQL
jgi:cardiolipin synthase